MTISVLGITLLLSGCASSSEKISASYVSPVQFQSFDCSQLEAESMRIKTRVSELAGNLDKASTNDKWITAGGVLLFWPALFALGGNQAQEAEYARLKGEYDAIHQSAVSKKCQGTVAIPVEAEATDEQEDLETSKL